MGSTFDKENTNSSYGAGAADASPIGTIGTSHSRRLRRKPPASATSHDQKRAKTADNAPKFGSPDKRYDRNVMSPPNFTNMNRPETGPTKKPPQYPSSNKAQIGDSSGQTPAHFINDDEDEFERDDDDEILNLLDQPDSKSGIRSGK
jgi:hypothetical protein